MDLLAIANGFDNSKRVFKIGVPLPESHVTGLVLVPISGRTDAVGFACHSQMIVARAGKEAVSLRMYVLLVSKQFCQPTDKDFDKAVIHAATEGLKLAFVDVSTKDNIADLPPFLLENIREDAIGSAVQMMQQQMMEAEMHRQARQKIVTPGPQGLVIPGQGH